MTFVGNRQIVIYQLRTTADYIDQHGWTQRKFETDDGRVCVSKAFTAAGSLATRLTFIWYLGVPSLFDWNDAPERTQEDVTSALRACAAQLEAGS